MQHFVIALCLFLAVLFFVLFPAKPPQVAATQPIWTSAEREYYRQIFYYTMDNVPSDTAYDWASYSGKGSITPQAAFVSKSGATCRNYVESFSVQGQTASAAGVTCKRAHNDGWCRLKPGNALTCAMETVSGAGGVHMSPGSLGSINTDVNLPDINGPSVTMPSVNTPHFDVKTPDAPDAKDVAGGVTGTAGRAAGSVTGKSIEWFSKIFR